MRTRKDFHTFGEYSSDQVNDAVMRGRRLRAAALRRAATELYQAFSRSRSEAMYQRLAAHTRPFAR